MSDAENTIGEGVATTRGGRGGRQRGRGGVRGRSGRAKGAPARSHPQVLEDNNHDMVDEVPEDGLLMEAPLQPKRRRTLVLDDHVSGSWSSAGGSTSAEASTSAAQSSGSVIFEPLPEEEDEGISEGPTTMYDFVWKAYPSSPISPTERREKFTGFGGPVIEPTSNPYDAFVKIWDRPIIEHIAHQTNLFAQNYAETLLQRGELGPRSRITKWRDTDADEIYLFFAVLMAMGIVIKSHIEHYWSSDKNTFSTPGFSIFMPLRRFQILSRCLHFSDDTNITSDVDSSQAKIFKLKPILDHLNLKFSTLYGLGQNITIEKSWSQWKGRLDIKQRKAASVDIETSELCDSRTGYLWRLDVHAGGETQAEQQLITGAIPNLVLRLLRGLENRGHTVWMNKFYNSPALARLLKTLGFDCVGTLCTDSEFVPQQITDLKKSDMREREVFGCTSGDVDLMVWRNKNRVATISTYHGVTRTENTLTPIYDYNIFMGAVDINDQMIAMFPIERKGAKIWYKQFFGRLLNVSILNAYILHLDFKPETLHREFRMTLVTEILQHHHQRAVLSELPAVNFRGNVKFSPEVIAHFPVSLPTLPGGPNVGKQRRRCVVCKKRTACVCNACNVALCFSLASPATTCYMQHHT